MQGALLCLGLCWRHRVASPLGVCLYHLPGKVPGDVEERVLGRELQVTQPSCWAFVFLKLHGFQPFQPPYASVLIWGDGPPSQGLRSPSSPALVPSLS